MSRPSHHRILALSAAVATAAGAAAVPMLRITRVAAQGNNCQPHVNSVSAQGTSIPHGSTGAAIVISGYGFAGILGAPCGLGSNAGLTETIGGRSWQVAPVSNGTTYNDTTIVIPAPGSAVGGPVTVSTSNATSNPDFVYVTDPAVSGLSTHSPNTGQPVSVQGTNLNLLGYARPPILDYAPSAGSCPASTSGTASSTAVTFAAPSQYCAAAVSLVESFVSDTGSGAVTSFTPPGGSSLGLTIAPQFSPLPPSSHAAAGSSLSVSGSGFGTSGSASLGGAPAPSSWTDTSVRVTIPDTAQSGALALVRGPDNAPINPGTLGVDARVDGISPATATEGDTVTISGGGFGSAAGSLTLGSTPVTPASWSATSITFTVPANVPSGAIGVKPSGNGAATTPTLTIAPRIGGVSPSNAVPGTALQITGVGFGANQGTVTIGGAAADVAVWGDGQIVVTVPAAAPAGSTRIVVTPPGMGSASAAFTVDRPPVAASGGGASSPTSAASPSSAAKPATATPVPGLVSTSNGLLLPSGSGPVIDPGQHVDFHRPKNTGPVALRLSTPTDAANPGKDVPFSLVLTAFGKPVAGAKVEIRLVLAPGSDASITPSEAITDADGRVSGVVHLSKVPGDHIILAQSGTASDEIRLVGRDLSQAGVGAAHVDSTFVDGAPKLLLVSALVLCLVLFLAGFAIQVLLPQGRFQPAAAGGGRLRSVLVRSYGIGEGVAALAQYAAVAAIVLPAQLLRRRR